MFVFVLSVSALGSGGALVHWPVIILSGNYVFYMDYTLELINLLFLHLFYFSVMPYLHYHFLKQETRYFSFQMKIKAFIENYDENSTFARKS